MKASMTVVKVSVERDGSLHGRGTIFLEFSIKVVEASMRVVEASWDLHDKKKNVEDPWRTEHCLLLCR